MSAVLESFANQVEPSLRDRAKRYTGMATASNSSMRFEAAPSDPTCCCQMGGSR